MSDPTGAAAVLAGAVLLGSLGLLAAAFAGYPAAIAILARRRGRLHRADDTYLPTVTVIVAARDEAAVIGAKADDILSLDYPEERLDAIVVSDGSTDGTDDIVRERASPRLRLIRQEPRAGKAAALARAFAEARAEVLVLTDANVIFGRDAVRKLVRHLADPAIGAATGTVHLVDAKPGYAQSEGLYYRFERFLQRAESRFESVVGVDGALYAVRRAEARPPPPEAVIDDFVISMEIARRGGRVVYDPEALAWEDAAPTVEQEFRRKARVARGALQALRRGWGTPGLDRPRLLFCWAGHKLARWLAPWALLGALASSAALAPSSGAAAALLGLQAALYALALLGLCVPAARRLGAVAVPFYFVLMHAAFAWGFLTGLSGAAARGVWERVDRRAVGAPGGVPAGGHADASTGRSRRRARTPVDPTGPSAGESSGRRAA